jgi:O-antigen ligase
MADTSPVVAAVAILGVCVAGWVAARVISAWTDWRPAGPIALLLAAPILPHVPIGAHLSLDDLLPVVGLALLVWFRPQLLITRNTLLRTGIAVLVALIVIRSISSIANGETLVGVVTMMAEAVGRPAFFLLVVILVAAAGPADVRRLFVARGLSVVGTFEALFGLGAFVLPYPMHAGVQSIRLLENLGTCTQRITGTLGLSPNHMGAVFVLTIPVTLGMATRNVGWPRVMWVAATVAQGAALILTFTRTSFVLAALAAIALLLFRRQLLVLLASVVGTGLMVLLVTSVACPRSEAQLPPLPLPSSSQAQVAQPSSPPRQTPDIVERLTDGNDRLALWYSAARLMVDNPIFGVGVGRSLDAMHARPSEYVDTPYGPSTSSAHNTILLEGAESGVLGAVVALLLNIVLLLIALRLVYAGRAEGSLNAAAGFGMLAFLTQGMVNNLFSVPATGILLAVLVGAFAIQERFVWPWSYRSSERGVSSLIA